MSRTVFGLVAIGVIGHCDCRGCRMARRSSCEQAAIDQPAQAAWRRRRAAPKGQPPAPLFQRHSPPANTAATTPSFDVARIGPDGRAVVAGRAAPGAKIVLLDGGKEIAKAEADSRGEWVVILQDPPLAVGQHELRVVQHIEGQARRLPRSRPWLPSCRSARRQRRRSTAARGHAGGDLASGRGFDPGAAAVGRRAYRGRRISCSPRSTTTIGVTSPSRARQRRARSCAPTSTIEMVAEATTATDGRWRLKPVGSPRTGQIQAAPRPHRQGRQAGGAPGNAFRANSPITPASDTDPRRLHVVRGDNLWNIARAHYGVGLASHGHSSERTRSRFAIPI